MNTVFVLSSTKKPLMPCRPARARRLLQAGRAAVYRTQPFTIILLDRDDGDVQPVAFNVDPGSKTTGLALVGEFPQQGRVALWAANLEHRGEAVRQRLTDRRVIRCGRRGRKTRYRAPRFDNRTRPAGWLPPSLRSRVDNVRTWYDRLLSRAPITSAAVELVRFDMQLMQDPSIEGVGYQQGTLAGVEVRQYVLTRDGHQCAYCAAKGVPLEIEHVVPRARGGSNRPSNLVAACVPCNQRKGAQSVEVFLADRPAVLAKVKARLKAPLKDAAAVNATRYAIGDALKEVGLPVSFWSGGRTKFNRTNQDYPKDHWIDAACVGEDGAHVNLDPQASALTITATGRGQRQVVTSDRFGFPRGGAGRVKRVQGFQTGDLVTLDQPRGKYAGAHTGRLTGIRATGKLDIKTREGANISAPWSRFTLVQRGDGYAYGQAARISTATTN
jgi:hypothetical protein